VRFLNDVCLRQMMLATPMMTATPNDVCLTAHWGQTSHHSRNEVEQHHFERSEKHHIAAGDASFDKHMNL